MTTSVRPPPQGPSLRIVCVNDVYTLDHLPRLRSLLQHHAATRPADRLLATLAGDFVAPSILSSLDKGKAMIDCLNALPITHVAFGNHEIDVGLAALRERVGQFQGTWLNTNMPTFTPGLPTHEIVEVTRPGGRTVRVGLLGLLVHDRSLYAPGAFGVDVIEPANETAVRWANRLVREEGCACVIPLTHQDLADDRVLARMQREPPFPLVVAGHDHEVSIEEIDGSWVIKAGANAAMAAVVDLVWPTAAPAAGTPDLPAVTVRLEDVRDYPEDPPMRARVDRHMKAVRELEKATLLRLPSGAPLSSVGMKVRQTALGTLLCSRIRDTLQVDGCVIQGGSIRGEHAFEERLTYGDLKAALPYANEMVGVRMPGRVLREIVAASRALAPEISNDYLQVDDQMTVEGPGAVVTAVGGRPLVDDREYTIAAIGCLLGGMSAIEPLVRFVREHPEKVPPIDSGREIKVILVDSFSIELWRQLGSFDGIDADHDGVITYGELKTAIARVTAEAPPDLVINDMIRVLDADGDQTISRDEAEKLVALAHAGKPEPPPASGGGAENTVQGRDRT